MVKFNYIIISRYIFLLFSIPYYYILNRMDLFMHRYSFCKLSLALAVKLIVLHFTNLTLQENKI